ncbi:MAG TPA: family 1 glycosylhydrolase [Armatimonadota bacterium]|nr:family 1 glycosylhydrolase [Armatimonadota bacterium]
MKPLESYGFAPEPEKFCWATGIEGSTIPQMGIDQYEWADHYRQFACDFDLARYDLGVRWVRYPIPWYRVNPAPGKYEWGWTDQALGYAGAIGITPIVNLCHFGTAAWIDNGFGNPDFPRYLEEYAQAFTERYRNLIRYYTPINEPLITALFAGDVGWWPPCWTGMENYTKVLANVCEGIVRAYRSIKAAQPDAVCVFADATELHRTNNPDLQDLMNFRNTRRFLLNDLITGRVDDEHPLRNWLREKRMPQTSIEWLQANPIELDVLGLDYYRHTERQIYWRAGKAEQRIAYPIRGLYQVAQDYCQRYDCPVFITETNWCGAVQHRIDWLKYTVSEVRRLREDGTPVVGFTWWPLFDHFDWEYAMTRAHGHIHPVGLFHLLPEGIHPDRRPRRLVSRHGSGQTLRRVSSALAETYHSLIENSDESVGFIGRTSGRQAQQMTPSKNVREYAKG